MEIQASSTATSNRYLGHGAWRAAGPVSSRLEPRCEASRSKTLIDLVRCSTIECFAWPVAVVPIDEQRQLPPKAIAPVGHQELSRALALDGPDEPLDDCDAPVFADRTEPLTNPSATAPLPECLVAKLLALVSDEMPGCAYRPITGPNDVGAGEVRVIG